jgi:hypothetical protein
MNPSEALAALMDAIPDDQQSEATMEASEVLYALTGEASASEPVTIRPVELAATLAVLIGKEAKAGNRRATVAKHTGPLDSHVKITDAWWVSGGVNVELENGQWFTLAIVPGKLSFDPH